MRQDPDAPLPQRIARLARSRLGLPRAGRLIDGNRIQLLTTGNEYFPKLLQAIGSAQRSIHLETYLYEDDPIGRKVTEALVEAAGRGVQVRLIIDGFGGGEHVRRLARELQPHGVQIRIYRAERWWRMQRRLFRRLHRKLVVIDEMLAFVGGINIIAEPADEPGPRLDFAVACEGPIVSPITLSAERLWWTLSLPRLSEPAVPFPRIYGLRTQQPVRGGVRAALLVRDNLLHRRTIERTYIEALASAQSDVLIASAYFIPGRRFRAALLDAARRAGAAVAAGPGRACRAVLCAARDVRSAAGRRHQDHPVHAQLPACEGGCDRRRLGHGRLQQSRSLQPVDGARS